MSFVIRTRGMGEKAPIIGVQGAKGDITTQSIVCLENGVVPDTELPPKISRAMTDEFGNPVTLIDSMYMDEEGNLVVVYNET